MIITYKNQSKGCLLQIFNWEDPANTTALYLHIAKNRVKWSSKSQGAVLFSNIDHATRFAIRRLQMDANAFMTVGVGELKGAKS